MYNFFKLNDWMDEKYKGWIKEQNWTKQKV